MCGYIYDDDKEDVKFEDLPEDWVCPMCFSTKSATGSLQKSRYLSGLTWITWSGCRARALKAIRKK